MPAGNNILFEFNTDETQGSTLNYAFNSGDNSYRPPEPLGILDAYEGCSVVGAFYVRTLYNISLYSDYTNDPTLPQLTFDFNTVSPYYTTSGATLQVSLETDRTAFLNLNVPLYTVENLHIVDNVIEYFDVDMFAISHSGSRFEGLDLATEPYNPTNFDFQLTESIFDLSDLKPSLTLEYSYPEYWISKGLGSTVELSLTYEARDIFLNNLTNICPHSETSGYDSRVVFDYGYDRSYAKDTTTAIDPLNSNLDFSVPVTDSHDITFSTQSATVDLGSWEFYQTCAAYPRLEFVPLEVPDKLLNIDFNMVNRYHDIYDSTITSVDLNEKWTGDEEETNLDIENTAHISRIHSNDPAYFKYDYAIDTTAYGTDITEMRGDPVLGNFDSFVNIGASASVELVFGCIFINDDGDDSTGFNLTTGEEDTTINLTNYVEGRLYGKNLNFDIFLCENEVNPAINTDSHNFYYKSDYQVACEELIYDAYHGAYAETRIAQSPLLAGNAYGGEFGLLDLAAERWLVPSARSGQELSTVVTFYESLPLNGGNIIYIDNGQEFNFVLITISNFTDLDSYHGADTAADLDVKPSEALADNEEAYHGQTTEFDLATLPIFQPLDAYHGLDSDLDFTSFPAIELNDVVFEHGSNVSGVLYTYVTLPLEGFHGLESDLDFTDVPAEDMKFDAMEHGAEGNITVLNISYYELSADAYEGIEATAPYLAFATTFGADAYHGGDGVTYLSTFGPPTLILDSYHGSNGVVDALSATFSLSPRAYAGSTLESTDIEIFPSQEISLDAYHGSTFEDITELDETNWLMYAWGGAEATIDFLSIPQALFPVAEHGHNATAGDVLNIGWDALPFEGFNGADSNATFTTVPPATLTFNAYHGSEATATPDPTVYPILVPREINASLKLVHGWGHYYGINFCETAAENLDPVYHDTAVRFIFTNEPGLVSDGRFDDLITDFANYDEQEAFYPCTHSLPVMTVDLLTYPRFQFETIMTGSELELTMPYKIEGFVDTTPPEYLYNNNLPLAEGDEWLLSVFTPARNDTPEVMFDFNEFDYCRFCPGYILPNGNSVNLEFNDSPNYDCESTNAYHGSFIENLNLVTEQSMASVNYNGSYARASLTVNLPWRLYAWAGQRWWASLATTVRLNPKELFTGATMWAEFYEVNHYAYHGANLEVDLVVPGPGVRWITPEGCIENQYIPLTPEGDVDLDAIADDPYSDKYPVVAVELKSYFHVLEATCVAYDSDGNEV